LLGRSSGEEQGSKSGGDGDARLVQGKDHG
jgi:hypothetical protein